MSRSQFDEDRFRSAVDGMMTLVSIAPPLVDLAFVDDELRKADAFGPFTDPTTWMKSAKDRAALTPLVEAARQFVAAAETFTKARLAIAAERATA